MLQILGKVNVGNCGVMHIKGCARGQQLHIDFPVTRLYRVVERQFKNYLVDVLARIIVYKNGEGKGKAWKK